MKVTFFGARVVHGSDLYPNPLSTHFHFYYLLSPLSLSTFYTLFIFAHCIFFGIIYLFKVQSNNSHFLLSSNNIIFFGYGWFNRRVWILTSTSRPIWSICNIVLFHFLLFFLCFYNNYTKTKDRHFANTNQWKIK